MKLIKRISTAITLLSATLFSQIALAYMELTYTSLNIPFTQGYVNGSPDDSVGSPGFTSFTATFNSAENGLTHNFTSAILDVGPIDFPNPVAASATDSSITLNPDGSVAAWHFFLSFVTETPGDEFNLPSRDAWYVESSYGENTCNCDNLFAESDLYITRPHNTWAYVGTLGFEYEGDNASTNWAIQTIEVPEPTSYALMMFGFAVMSLARILRSLAGELVLSCPSCSRTGKLFVSS